MYFFLLFVVCRNIMKFEGVIRIMNEIFRRRLRQLRLEKGVGCIEMSEKLKMTRNYIYNIEAGYAYPSMTQFFAICEYLDVAPYEFLKFEPGYTSKEEELLDVVNGFSPEEMDRVITLAKGVKG